MPFTPLLIKPAPGIQRDNTQFSAQACVDGQWCRFQNGHARKIGGCYLLSNRLSGISRGLAVLDAGSFAYVQSGWSGGIDQFTIDMNGNVSAVVSRTPVGFAPNANYYWIMDQMWDATSTTTLTFAVAVQSLNDITNTTESQVYYGNVVTATPFAAAISTASTPITTAGCLRAIHPFLVLGDSFGNITWSDVNLPFVYSGGLSGSARATASKIVQIYPLRGGAGSSPAMIIWSLDSLLVANFVGSPGVFQFSTISDQSTIMSAQSVVEYDGLWFWCGIDRFLMYNGTVQEIPNTLNRNWFFDNLNYTWVSKVFGFAVKRWGEIWWCYPRGNATECTHAVIYNVRENVWYDTQLPGNGRSQGYPSQVFRSPIMTGVDPYNVGGNIEYGLWRHEYGTDIVDINRIPQALNSYFTTDVLSYITSAGAGNAVSIDHIEPDFVQSGNMYCQLFGKANPAAPDVGGTVFTFPATYTTPDDTVIQLRDQRRLARVQFGSNVAGGTYQHGQSIMYAEQGDERFRP